MPLTQKAHPLAFFPCNRSKSQAHGSTWCGGFGAESAHRVPNPPTASPIWLIIYEVEEQGRMMPKTPPLIDWLEENAEDIAGGACQRVLQPWILVSIPYYATARDARIMIGHQYSCQYFGHQYSLASKSRPWQAHKHPSRPRNGRPSTLPYIVL